VPDRLKVAVLMPAWNASRFIAEAIQSLLVQREAASFDIIVVDDGSTDSTVEIVTNIARAAPEVRLIALPHRGLPSARNAALAAISPDTDIVTFLDADDLSPPGRFARDLAALTSDVDVYWGMTQRFEGGEYSPELERGAQLGALLIRAAAIGQYNGFSEDFPIGEDVDFLLRMLETQPRLRLSDQIAVLYRLHDANSTRNRALVRQVLTRAYLAAARRRLRGAPEVPAGLFRPLGTNA